MVKITAMRSRSRIRGFTLIEIIVATAVLGILASLSIPMYTSTIAGNRTRSAAYSLVGSLTYARSEAVKRNAIVSVAPVGTGWQDGWTVTSGGVTLSLNEPAPALALAGPIAGVSYLPTGRLNIPGNVLFTISASNTGYTRCVTIDPGGRPSLAKGERNDGSCV
jgi:type IV fimbrial biogenesis protein FimT